MKSRWEVEAVDQYFQWEWALPFADQAAIGAAIERLIEHGPLLRRPMVGEIVLEPDYRQAVPLFGKHLKELRVAGDIRILFTFDPRRTAVLLVGGDKHGEWSRWYRRAIPEAADLYRTYLDELRSEGLL